MMSILLACTSTGQPPTPHGILCSPFEACFTAWAQSFAKAFEREVVAIDGQTS
jgi:hypothetical protein